METQWFSEFLEIGRNNVETYRCEDGTSVGIIVKTIYNASRTIVLPVAMRKKAYMYAAVAQLPRQTTQRATLNCTRSLSLSLFLSRSLTLSVSIPILRFERVLLSGRRAWLIPYLFTLLVPCCCCGRFAFVFVQFSALTCVFTGAPTSQRPVIQKKFALW